MNRKPIRFHRRLAGPPLAITTALALAFTLSGCDRPPDCDAAAALGQAVGESGLPMDADRYEVAPACHEHFDEGWEKGKTRFCDPENAFARGLSDTVYYGICDSREFRSDFELGRTLRVLRVEQEAIALQLDAIETGQFEPAESGEPAYLRRRARTLERELADLETLARIRGLLEPAELPETGYPPGDE